MRAGYPVTEFRPTLPPPGRLVRLGLVLDTRNAPSRVTEIARMCDGSGIDALWVRDELIRDDDDPRHEAWTVLMVARDVRRSRIGLLANTASRAPALLAAMAGTLDAAVTGRLEIALTPGSNETEHLGLGLFPQDDAAWRRLERYAAIVRASLAGGLKLSIGASSALGFAVAAREADDVILPPLDFSGTTAAVEQVRAACEEAGRDPATLGIAFLLPVSVGRTTAEARARADAEPLFRTIGEPGSVGLFGTLEQCQEQVIELAHAGVTDLRCILPNAPDLPDVLAQLTATAIGTTDVLTPGSAKSKSPDPPASWGGRAPRD